MPEYKPAKYNGVSYPKYLVGNDGTVWRNGKQLKPRLHRKVDGYFKVTLCYRFEGEKRRVEAYVHKLVWESFKGQVRQGYEVHHEETKNHLDNRLEVLGILPDFLNKGKYNPHGTGRSKV